MVGDFPRLGQLTGRRITSFIRELALRQLEQIQRAGQEIPNNWSDLEIPSNWSDLTAGIREEDICINGDDQ